LASSEGIFTVGRPAHTHECAVIRRVKICQLFAKEVDNAEGAVFGYYGKMLGVRGKGEGGDAMVWYIPGSNRVWLLVLTVDRLIDMEGIEISRKWICSCERATVSLRGERGIFALCIVDNQGAIHVGSQEQILWIGEPANFGNRWRADYVLKCISHGLGTIRMLLTPLLIRKYFWE